MTLVETNKKRNPLIAIRSHLESRLSSNCFTRFSSIKFALFFLFPLSQVRHHEPVRRGGLSLPGRGHHGAVLDRLLQLDAQSAYLRVLQPGLSGGVPEHAAIATALLLQKEPLRRPDCVLRVVLSPALGLNLLFMFFLGHKRVGDFIIFFGVCKKDKIVWLIGSQIKKKIENG